MTEPTDFVAAWNDWHESRVRATTSPLGLASLVATHWLTTEPAAYQGLPGVWHASGGSILGTAPELHDKTMLQDGRPYDTVSGAEIVLEAGQDIEWGDKRIRYFERDGALALRLIDPDAATRSSLTDIDAFEPDPAWVLKGRFTPAEPDATRTVEAIDGHVSEDAVAGTVDVDLPGGEHATLTVSADPRGLAVVLSDGTSGDETYRFRFLTIASPADDGTVTVDFNRLYLPPCAFADFYVCPLPPAGNRLATPIRAGEKNVVRA
ncbi:hypothetical protein SAMN04489806_0178 [Paramicrobacterium humi]|uniref:DUF1684 domain-containing protein n=1 Tax=Paramicrobacterium humi TaxID=640635 RepID=A0A1H4IRS7_9MICO|nr:DUF1684 domain-containing protein [Microbacterium humi]SEB36545.1 hypothetical protein SAMN04489806_0178 [Microbacterium humi]